MKWNALLKVLLPLPACDRSAHLQCGFHLLFESLRNCTCHLTQLNLSKSSISVADAMCLGESLRKNRTLVSLRLQGSLSVVFHPLSFLYRFFQNYSRFLTEFLAIRLCDLSRSTRQLRIQGRILIVIWSSNFIYCRLNFNELWYQDRSVYRMQGL